MQDKNITLPVVIRQSQRKKLDVLAKENERSLSFFAREALDDLLAKYGLTKETGGKAEAASLPVGESHRGSVAQSAAGV